MPIQSRQNKLRVGRRLRISPLIACALFINACSGSDNTNANLLAENANPALNSSTPLSMALPRGVALAMGRASTDGISGLYALASFNNGTPLCFEPNPNDPASFDARQQATVRVNQGETLAIEVNWFETLDNTQACDGNGLLLAVLSQTTAPITGNSTIELDEDDYQLDGLASLDDDLDGVANLAERQAGTDPFDENDPASEPAPQPEPGIDVRISFVDPSDAPIIDGLYDDIYNDRAQFNDDRGEPLAIDNLMVDMGVSPNRSDGDTDFRWLATYDDTWLYIFVLGELFDTATPVRDSTAVFQDDSVDIFIDGNNSRGTSYDGVDDRHILIPLITSPTDRTSNSTVFEAGPNSAPLPDFEFSSCLCTSDRHTWEIRLPLDGFGIQAGSPFGLEVQLNLDNDGGARDEKWGWIHPSRVNVDTDNTFMNPSFMATAVLN